MKINKIFSKVANKQQNKIYCYSSDLLNQIKPNRLTAFVNVGLGNLPNIQKVNVKWRNFVDDDENNSLE